MFSIRDCILVLVSTKTWLTLGSEKDRVIAEFSLFYVFLIIIIIITFTLFYVTL